MRKTMWIACLVAAGVLGSTATASAADTCTATATWNMTPQETLTQSVASGSATGTGCSAMLPPAGATYKLLGVQTVGLPFLSIGTAQRTDGRERGEYDIWQTSFYGFFTSTTADGDTVRTTYEPVRGCGARCWVTKGTWTRD
jgi:hypothetical protein